MREGYRRRPGDKIIRRQRLHPRRLRRVLGLPALYSIGYGNVGSSIYYALGLVAMTALGATPIALGIAGIFFVFTALTYAEGTAAIPEAGGSASFARHAFNELVSFIAGWGLMLGYIVTIAISAYTIPPYLGYFFAPFKDSAVLGTFTSIGIVLFLMMLNVVGVRETALLNLVAALIDIVLQATLIVLGFALLFTPEKLQAHVTGDWPDFSGLAYGVSIAMVAYIGLESVAQVAEEARIPEKRVPRAMILVVATVIVMYAGISLTALSGMTPHELATDWSTDPVAGIANALPIAWLRALLAPVVGLLAATILLIATNAGLLGVSRLAFSMSSHREIPAIFSRVHSRFKTPYASVIGFSLIAMAIMLPGMFSPDLFRNMGALYGFGAMTAFSLAHLSIIALRVRRPDMERPFRLPGSIRVKGKEVPLTAVIGLVSTVTVWVVVVVLQPYSRYVGLAWMLAGLIFYVWYRRRQKLSLTEVTEARM